MFEVIIILIIRCLWRDQMFEVWTYIQSCRKLVDILALNLRVPTDPPPPCILGSCSKSLSAWGRQQSVVSARLAYAFLSIWAPDPSSFFSIAVWNFVLEPLINGPTPPPPHLPHPATLPSTVSLLLLSPNIATCLCLDCCIRKIS